MRLVLTRCIVRSWRREDADLLARHANDREVWRNLRDRFPHPYTTAHAREWIAAALNALPETHFAVAVGDEAIGGIGFDLQPDVYRRSAEIGYWLGRAWWGRGIATEVVEAMTAHVFAHFDVCRVFATVFEGNAASARVLEKAGYACEGRLARSVTKDGATIDSWLYATVREPTGRRAT